MLGRRTKFRRTPRSARATTEHFLSDQSKDIIKKCTNKEPGERPSFEDLARDWYFRDATEPDRDEWDVVEEPSTMLLHQEQGQERSDIPTQLLQQGHWQARSDTPTKLMEQEQEAQQERPHYNPDRPSSFSVPPCRDEDTTKLVERYGSKIVPPFVVFRRGPSISLPQALLRVSH
ncbi:hypothetical protein BGX33_007187 [Mortierella sp. NVP41]|nr:hypothetical protein BGX33_007187 [Mortierella sp. NVP41]